MIKGFILEQILEILTTKFFKNLEKPYFQAILAYFAHFQAANLITVISAANLILISVWNFHRDVVNDKRFHFTTNLKNINHKIF